MKVFCSSLNGSLRAPASKSLTHRSYLLGMLSEGVSVIENPLVSEDTERTLKAVQLCGAAVTKTENSVIIAGGRFHSPEGEINCGNSASTMRMLTGIAAQSECIVRLTGDDSLKNRPMQPLLSALSSAGVSVESYDGYAPFSVTGPMKRQEIAISADLSSQFISGLMLGAPRTGLTITFTTSAVSKPYLEMTACMMEQFGAEVRRKDTGYIVKKGAYHARRIRVSGDYSSASYLLAAGVLSGKVTVTGLNPGSFQGDKAVITFLAEFGAKLSISGESVTAEKSSLHGVSLDLTDTPDLFPILAVCAAFADGTSVFTGISRLRTKESDRLAAVTAFLKAMGADISIDADDKCIIRGGIALHGAKVSSAGDHRITMAACIAGLAAEGYTEIDDISCTAVSYPSFLQDIRNLGAKLE